MIWRATEGDYIVQRDPVLKLVAYLADEWAWGDGAEDCLDAMRAEVTP